MVQKKYIIIGASVIVLLALLGAVLYFFRDNKQVTFAIDYPEATAVISPTRDPKEKFVSIENGSSLWLKKQTYYIYFENEKLSKEPLVVTVDDTTTKLELNANFSESVLQDILTSEQKAINTEIKKSIVSGAPATPNVGALYHHGEWYATTLPVYKASSADPEIGNPDNVNLYYLVLKKDGSGWKIVAGPSLIITKPDHPSVPDYIIDAINPVQTQLE